MQKWHLKNYDARAYRRAGPSMNVGYFETFVHARKSIFNELKAPA